MNRFQGSGFGDFGGLSEVQRGPKVYDPRTLGFGDLGFIGAQGRLRS